MVFRLQIFEYRAAICGSTRKLHFFM